MPQAITNTTPHVSPPGAAERRAMASGTMDILAAMRDPMLFGPHFKGDTWKPWQTFLSGLFGLPMNADALALFQQHTGRSVAPEW